MPRKAFELEDDLQPHHIPLVTRAVAEFALTGGLSVDVVVELTNEGLDYKSILDACMSHPAYQSTIQ